MDKIRLGANELHGLFIGNNEVIKIYFGTQVIYEQEAYLYSSEPAELVDKNGTYLIAADQINN